MRMQLMTAAAVVLLSAGATAQPRPQPALIGTWKSAPDELKLTTDFDKSVWGANATSIRTVELIVRSQTEATLRVVKKVVNAKRQTVPASTWIEEAQLQLGAAAPGVADRRSATVTRRRSESSARRDRSSSPWPACANVAPMNDWPRTASCTQPSSSCAR